jgi:hypothetical protein
MKITVEGTVYEHDVDNLLLSEALDIQEKLGGMTLVRWQYGLDGRGAIETKALVYLLKKRAGEKVDWDTLEFNLATVEYEDVPDDENGEGEKSLDPGGQSSSD